VTGIPHPTGVPSGSPVFSIAAAGARGGALSVLLKQEERGTVGFGAGGAGVCVFYEGGVLFMSVRVICVICVSSYAPHIYKYLYINN